jgi:hypothetical protein
MEGLTEVGCEGVARVLASQDRTLVNAEIKFWVL